MMQMGSGQRVKQHVEILFIRMQTCTNGAQALATLTPAGQLGTPEGFCLIDGEDSVTKVGSSVHLIKFKFHFKGFFNSTARKIMASRSQ